MPFKMTLSVAQGGCLTEPFRLLLGLGGLEPAISGCGVRQVVGRFGSQRF